MKNEIKLTVESRSQANLRKLARALIALAQQTQSEGAKVEATQLKEAS